MAAALYASGGLQAEIELGRTGVDHGKETDLAFHVGQVGKLVRIGDGGEVPRLRPGGQGGDRPVFLDPLVISAVQQGHFSGAVIVHGPVEIAGLEELLGGGGPGVEDHPGVVIDAQPPHFRLDFLGGTDRQPGAVGASPLADGGVDRSRDVAFLVGLRFGDVDEDRLCFFFHGLFQPLAGDQGLHGQQVDAQGEEEQDRFQVHSISFVGWLEGKVWSMASTISRSISSFPACSRRMERALSWPIPSR